MSRSAAVGPEQTAARVALWRALHVLADAPPHVLVDEVGLALVAPEPGWRERPDMSPFTRPFRASILARARFVEDLVTERASQGVGQYVILGAGLDTFASSTQSMSGAGHSSTSRDACADRDAFSKHSQCPTPDIDQRPAGTRVRRAKKAASHSHSV